MNYKNFVNILPIFCLLVLSISVHAADTDEQISAREKACEDQCLVDITSKPREILTPERYNEIVGGRQKCRQACFDAAVAAHTALKNSISTLSTSSMTEAENKYRDRYYKKCMSDFGGEKQAASCCSNLAAKDAESLRNKGAFDTSTTAEIPVFVDDSQCPLKKIESSPGEFAADVNTIKCMRSLMLSGVVIDDSNRAKEEEFCRAVTTPVAADTYISKCLQAGKYGPVGKATDDAKFNCRLDYEKEQRSNYVNECLKSGTYRKLSIDERKKGCNDNYQQYLQSHADTVYIVPKNTPAYTQPKSFYQKIKDFFSSFFGR